MGGKVFESFMVLVIVTIAGLMAGIAMESLTMKDKE